jgi:hypothetical protein
MTGAWNDPAVRAAVAEVTGVPRLECLDGPEGCRGPVEWRMALSATGRNFPRCDRHWANRLRVQAAIGRRYPDQATPPADFDPGYAGESWDED